MPYDSLADYEFRRNLKSLVTVYDGALNRPRRTMTSTWYKNANKEAIKSLKNDIRNYFQHVVKATATKDEIAWTCIAGRQNDLKGNGYVRVRKLTPDESRLPKEQREQRERELNCFVACNAIATNAFRHRWALAYCVDIRHNPMIAGWLEKQHILVGEESFSLSCFLQWLCRSRVRDGLPVQIYIPSARIRELFSRYLSETDEAKAA